MSRTFEQLYLEFGHWTEEVLPEAGPVEHIIHGKKEMDELKAELQKDVGFTYSKTAEEFADCFMCLMGAAYKRGLTSENVLIAIQRKFEVNKTRKWKLNPDNTYSHIPEEAI